MPRAKRMGWVVVAVIGVLVSMLVSPVLLYRYDESAGSEPSIESSYVYYEGCKFNRWSGRPVSPEFRIQWFSPGRPPLVRVLSVEEGQWFNTDYALSGEAVLQSFENGRVDAPPWPHPLSYSPAEVLDRIHNAKLFVEQAAARGEIVLPEWWETVK